jgi:hypothetical protein
MAKEKTPGQNAAQVGPEKPTSSASGSAKKSSSKKNSRLQVGGSAVQGAKSTLPKQISSGNNPQQQEAESYNRTTRRRMQNIGAGPYAGENRKVKSPQERRKEKVERIKQKRAAQVEAVKKTLPGGKIKTDMSRVVRMVLVVGGLIVLLIAIFVALRLTGTIQ